MLNPAIIQKPGWSFIELVSALIAKTKYCKQNNKSVPASNVKSLLLNRKNDSDKLKLIATKTRKAIGIVFLKRRRNGCFNSIKSQVNKRKRIIEWILYNILLFRRCTGKLFLNFNMISVERFKRNPINK